MFFSPRFTCWGGHRCPLAGSQGSPDITLTLISWYYHWYYYIIMIFNYSIIILTYLENHIHINPVGVGPGMLEVFLQTLFQRIGDLEKIVMLIVMLHIEWTFISRLLLCYCYAQWTFISRGYLGKISMLCFIPLSQWQYLFWFCLPDRICWILSLAALRSDTCSNLISGLMAGGKKDWW